MSGKRYFPANEGETDEQRAQRVIYEKRQRNAGKLTKKNMEHMEKAHAMCVVDFLGGNMRQAALMTGHTVGQLQQWRQDLEGDDYKLKFLRYRIATNVEGVLVNYMQSLAIIALEKARGADFKDITAAIAIATRQVGNLKTKNEARTIQQRKKNELKPHKRPEERVVEPPDPPPVPEPEPVAPIETTERGKYENIVSQVVAESFKTDKPLTRDEAINAVIMQRPEAKQFLRPDAIEALDTSVQEYEN